MPKSAVQLAEIVELLGQLWLYEVSRETLVAMGTEQFADPYVELGGFVPEVVNKNVIDDLAVEYCALLIGPKGHVSPVQSVWLDNQFQSKTAASMNRFFELIPGYRPASNLSDHIGVQLDFLSAVLRQPDEGTANEIAKHFAQSHLQWALKFVDKIETVSNSDFYQGLARVTRKLISTINER